MSHHDKELCPEHNTDEIHAELALRLLTFKNPSQLSDAFRFGYIAAIRKRTKFELLSELRDMLELELSNTDEVRDIIERLTLSEDEEEETQKIVINAQFGGFGLSEAAIYLYANLAGFKIYENRTENYVEYFKIPYDEITDENYDEFEFEYRDLERTDPILIDVVERLGHTASDQYSNLVIVEVPKGVSWHIHEYEGKEHVAEDHRIWR